jgi:PleD family two-component response regulator
VQPIALSILFAPVLQTMYSQRRKMTLLPEIGFQSRRSVVSLIGGTFVRVLVVEDEVRLAENIAAALRDGPNYAVDICHDGEQALLFCQTAEYDLAILDLMIPRIRGNEVLRQLRRQKSQLIT